MSQCLCGVVEYAIESLDRFTVTSSTTPRKEMMATVQAWLKTMMMMKDFKPIGSCWFALGLPWSRRILLQSARHYVHDAHRSTSQTFIKLLSSTVPEFVVDQGPQCGAGHTQVVCVCVLHRDDLVSRGVSVAWERGRTWSRGLREDHESGGLGSARLRVFLVRHQQKRVRV